MTLHSPTPILGSTLSLSFSPSLFLSLFNSLTVKGIDLLLYRGSSLGSSSRCSGITSYTYMSEKKLSVRNLRIVGVL
jgi:hypothetical protein